MISQKIIVVPLAVVTSLVILYITVQFAPEGGGENLKFPSSLEDIRSLSDLLTDYNRNHPVYVFLLFSMAYLFKQTFAVPGSVFLNVLAGAIFGSVGGFLLCSSLTATGASLCYLLARAVGKDAALRYFPDRLQTFGEKLEENKQELPFFLLFLRLFPMSPNWALNMASGVLGRVILIISQLRPSQYLSGVPLHLFFFSVFFGLMPYNYLCVTSGVILSEIQTVSDMTLSQALSRYFEGWGHSQLEQHGSMCHDCRVSSHTDSSDETEKDKAKILLDTNTVINRALPQYDIDNTFPLFRIEALDTMPEDAGVVTDDVKTDTVLSRKMKKILDSKLENDNDTMDALKELSTFFTENNLKNRRNLRGEIERRNLQINHDFLAAFETVKVSLDSLHSNVVGMSKSCSNMQERLAASKTVTEELMRKTTEVQSATRRLQVQQEVADRFRDRLSLTREEEELLQARPGQHKISAEFFSVLDKVGRIRADCRVLLAAGHQTAALSTLDKMTELQEAGLDRLYRWALSSVRNTELGDPALAQLSRGLHHLQEREVLLQQVVEEFTSTRRAALVRSFIEALTVGGPGGAPRPIELQAHEPARYIGDMLAWLHQAWPGERETVAGLVKQCDRMDRAELETRVMVGATEGVCRPLQSRVEQILVSEPSPVTLYQLTNIIRFYQSTMSSVVTSSSSLSTTLAELSQLAVTQFMSRLSSSVSSTLGRGEVLGGDLAPAPATSSLLQLVREVLASHSVVEESKEDVPAILSCVCDPLTAQLQATANKLPSQDGAVFLINNLHQVRTMLSLYQTPDSRLEELAARIDSSLKVLSSHQTSHLLSALGLTSLLPLLPAGDGTPLSTVPGCHHQDILNLSARLDNFLAAPDLILLPATRLLLSSQHRRMVTTSACSQLSTTYTSLYTAVTDPVNGYQAGVLTKTPDQVNKLLQL